MSAWLLPEGVSYSTHHCGSLFAALAELLGTESNCNPCLLGQLSRGVGNSCFMQGGDRVVSLAFSTDFQSHDQKLASKVMLQ